VSDQYQVLDLFSGIGGFALGLERAGMETVAFCEQDGYARRVLRKHWPGTWLYEDVRTLTKARLKADGLKPNVICGGFPCQDISCAGKGAGIEGPRSGLWSEYVRLIGDLRPRFAIVENVPNLLCRGFGRVLGDLARIGFDAEWSVISACSMGFTHTRKRMFIVAYPGGGRRPRGLEFSQIARQERHDCDLQSESEPVRVAHGIPHRVDRHRCLGNAILPQIAELIGRSLIEWDRVSRLSPAAA
jgi:DNA (cytosine-5)-methyltransferase 1